MSLAAGTRLGSYQISTQLGAGGMGVVYRAKDLKLGREVALKVLPASFMADADRLARFEREAKVLASLNHPNVAQVYDAGHAVGGDGGTTSVAYLAMELVEGEDLTARIAGGPLPLTEALSIAREIALALDAAHGHGIVHRDLKPGNIRLTSDGQVKVLDFGLAKAADADDTSPASGSGAAANSPTLTARATAMGMIVGTAAYMAPEQARGRPVDKRADIWAFGCVLFEMATGSRLFRGEDMTETLAAVVKEEPDLAPAPAELRRLLRRCLEKDPRKRLRDIGDAWDLLDEPRAVAAGAGARPAGRARLPWAIAAAAVIVAGVLGVATLRPGPAVEPTEFEVAWPADTGPSGGSYFALSPNGRHLALASGRSLWVRSLDALQPIRLDRTDGASYPFWSPDSDAIGFFADGQLKRVARTGGVVTALAAAPVPRGGSWSPNGAILFSDALGYRGLQRVADAGGKAEPVTAVSTTGQSDAHRYPHFLSDGNRFLYLHLSGNAAAGGVFVGSLTGEPPRRLLDAQESALYVPGRGGQGHLLTRHGDTLMTYPFDAERAAITGAAVQVVEGVGLGENTGLGAFSASDNGVLVTAPGVGAFSRVFPVDRTGVRGAALTPLLSFNAFAFSRDGRRLALAVATSATSGEVRTMAAGDETASRFTFGSDAGWTMPVWSPDERRIAYTTFDLAGLPKYEIRLKAADMTGTEEAVATSTGIIRLWEWASDNSLLFTTEGTVWRLPLAGARTREKLAAAQTGEEFVQMSPDGRFIAYAGGPRTSPQVFVQPVPATGAIWQISSDGGSMPRWRRDGLELYYRREDGQVMAVATTLGAANTFRHGVPAPRFGGVPAMSSQRFTYQPLADGRFAMLVFDPTTRPALRVVQHWDARLTRR